jgi:glycosyltransferase involved in cell wall biosynthesis
MGLGKPAVVSDYGGNPEVIKDGENGFVVPQKNANALAMALAQLLQDDDKRIQMGKRAVEIFTQRFTAKAMTKNMENFYYKLLGE